MRASFKGKIYPVLFLTIVVLISISSLTATNGMTKGKIMQIRKENIKDMMKTHYPNMDRFEYKDNLETYFIYNDDTISGYAFESTVEGYGGPIEILIALDGSKLSGSDVIIEGISIINHEETPGLGAKITKSSFKNQFNKIKLSNIDLSEEGGKIDAISGATISSSAVIDGVREITKEKLEKLVKVR